MTNAATIVLGAAGALLVVAGFTVQGVALARWGDDGAPRGPVFDPRAWRPVWRCRAWFREPIGFERYVMGDAMWTAGLILFLLAALARRGGP